MKPPHVHGTDPSHSDPTPPPKKPLWETLVIVANFVGVWIYFLAWIAAGRAKEPLAIWWQFLLLPLLVALVVVFLRRIARAKHAVRENTTPRPPRF